MASSAKLEQREVEEEDEKEKEKEGRKRKAGKEQDAPKRGKHWGNLGSGSFYSCY